MTLVLLPTLPALLPMKRPKELPPREWLKPLVLLGAPAAAQHGMHHRASVACCSPSVAVAAPPQWVYKQCWTQCRSFVVVAQQHLEPSCWGAIAHTPVVLALASMAWVAWLLLLLLLVLLLLLLLLVGDHSA